MTSKPVRYCNKKAVDEVQPRDVHLHVGWNPSTKKQDDKLEKNKRCPRTKKTDEESGQKLPPETSAVVVGHVGEQQNGLVGKGGNPHGQQHGDQFPPADHESYAYENQHGNRDRVALHADKERALIRREMVLNF